MKELNKEEFKKEIADYLKVLFRKSIDEADDQQKFQAVSYAAKDFVVDQWMSTHKTYEEEDVKTVYYLSRMKNQMLHLAMGVLDVLQHVSLIHFQHLDILHMAVGYVINMACLNRLLKMATR